MAKFNWKRYAIRELSHILLYPIIFLIIVFSASALGYVKAEFNEILNLWVILTVLASIITFAISYWFARRRKKLF